MPVRIRHVDLDSRDIEDAHLPRGDILRVADSYQHAIHLHFVVR
jgi:hypothetical protein